ncbi:MAG: molybdopterin-dependent oxidoreductase [Acidobacteriota bacterium]|nr:molybdopterin-dependent oxidoreductase [Acidobacteriota bacterium]
MGRTTYNDGVSAKTRPSKFAPTRRTFLTGAIMGTGASLVPAQTDIAANQRPQSAATTSSPFDFTQSSPVLEADETIRSACQFCNANCGLAVGTRGGRVVSIQGLGNDPVQAGRLCVKADLMGQLVYNPYRLTTPLLRTGGRKGDPDRSHFREASWEEALEVVATKFLALRDQGEVRAIANRTTGRMLRGGGALVARFFELLGSPNATDVGPVCNDAGGNALSWTLGLGNFTNGYGVDPATGEEDLGSAALYLLLGTNQAETHPVTFAHLLEHRERNRASLVVVDPRKTPTGAYADHWLAPKPHTDLALVLGMLHEIITNELYDEDSVRRWVLGFDELAAHVTNEGYTAEWAGEVCGLAASDIRQLARTFATAKPAAIFCNAGISHQLGAFDTYRALIFLAAITGNIGVPGGGCNFMHNTWPGGLDLPPLTVTTPERGQGLPVGPDYFAESVLSGSPYALRAVVTEGNPLLASANTSKVRAAFEQLDFYVYTGLFMEEAAYYADVVLPVCSGLETDGVYMRRDDRAIRWQQAAVSRVGESRTDVEIWIDLAHTMGRLDQRNPASYWVDAFPLSWKQFDALWAEFVAHTAGAGGMTRERLLARAEPLRWPCPTVGHPGVSTLFLDAPSWYDAARDLGGAEGQRFLTPSGKIEIFTPELDTRLRVAGHSALPIFYTHPEVTGGHPSIVYEDQMVTNPVNPQAVTPRVRLGERSEGGLHEAFPLMGMIGRSSVVHFAGVTHWTQTGKQLDGVRLVQLHPAAATRAGVADGDEVWVESPRGRVRGTALVWEDMRPDTVFVPNGFGFAQRVGPDTGAQIYEDPANTLVDDRYYDNLSGQQAYKCFACRVIRTSSA